MTEELVTAAESAIATAVTLLQIVGVRRNTYSLIRITMEAPLLPTRITRMYSTVRVYAATGHSQRLCHNSSALALGAGLSLRRV